MLEKYGPKGGLTVWIGADISSDPVKDTSHSLIATERS
jgi:hypothetical protein